MDSKLERFFNAINFNKDYYDYFKESSVNDVLLNKKLNKMTLVLNMPSEVPIDVFKELYVKGKN